MVQSQGCRSDDSWDLFNSLTQHSESALNELFKQPGETSVSEDSTVKDTAARDPVPTISCPQEAEPVASTSLGKRKRSTDVSIVQASKLRRADVEQDNVYIIAHDPSILDAVNQLAYGVQYMLAYLISNGPNTMANDESLMRFVKGDVNVSSPAMEKQMFAQEFAANSPWEELDKEDRALAKDEYAGLGNHPDYPGWYGGKVAFKAKVKQEQPGRYKIVLDRGAAGSSCRLTRRFGSKSFIRVKVEQSAFYDHNNRLNEFFQQKFVLWGHVFQACYAKDDNVFLFKVNETMKCDGSLEKIEGMSLEDFVNWFNPLDENQKQPMSKWASRFSLGFSNSVPGPQISAEDLHREDDIVSDCQSDMTDGCGYCNFKLLSYIRQHYDLDKTPTAIQFRLGGCKGMLVLREEDSSPGDSLKVWVRPSQTKIKGQPTDPGHLTLDLLRMSYVRTPAQISSEVIINISENSFGSNMSNASHDVLPELMEKALMDMVESFTTWEGPDAMYKLWATVEKAGGVNLMRKGRDMVGQQRFMGLGNRDYEDEDDSKDEAIKDKDDGEFDSKSVAWWPDQISGCPSSLEETVMYFLDAGFTPQRCPVLREKLKKILETKINNKIDKMKIVINYSATAFVIPDPFGVLEPNEIQFKSSQYNFRMPDGTTSNIVLGDVLLSRSPCKLPTDVRKVKAVEYPVLYKYTDVIVCSVKGSRRFIDYLAGGDYDGDTALAIWEPRLAEPFQNANDDISVEPDAVKPGSATSCFDSTKETVRDFVTRNRMLDPQQRTMKLQKCLLRSVRGVSLTGTYSGLHENAVYKHGYGSSEAILLAYKFCKVLDGPKSGLVLKDGILGSDRKKFGASLGPVWKDPKHKKAGAQSNLTYEQRNRQGPHIKGSFIMDILLKTGEDLRKRLTAQMDVTFAPLGKDAVRDEDLERPWLNAWEPVQKLLGQHQKPESPATDHQKCDGMTSSAGSSTTNSDISSSSTVTLAGSSSSSVQLIIAQAKQRDLKRIEEHVKASYQVHANNKKAMSSRLNRSKSKNSEMGGGGGADFTNCNIIDRQDVLRKSSKFFHEHPTPEEMEVITDSEEIARLRASYAYMYDLEVHKYGRDGKRRWSRFPFDVAARELCAIKANSLGPSKTVTCGFYEKYRMVKQT